MFWYELYFDSCYRHLPFKISPWEKIFNWFQLFDKIGPHPLSSREKSSHSYARCCWELEDLSQCDKSTNSILPKGSATHQTAPNFWNPLNLFLGEVFFPNRINFCLYFYKFQKNWWRNTALEIKVKRTVWFTFVKSLFRMIFGAISQ